MAGEEPGEVQRLPEGIPENDADHPAKKEVVSSPRQGELAIQFSGGKDSLVCLHLFKDEPGVRAFYLNTGAVYPHVADFVTDTCEAFGVPLTVVESNVLEWQENNGLPADIVPWDSTPAMKGVAQENFGATLVPYIACCSANIWEPMLNALKKQGIKKVIRGSKSCDSHVGVSHGFIDDGIEYLSPLWDWSHDDVFAYIKKHDLKLPHQYNYSEYSDSLDCWCCTAYMSKTGRARLSYTETFYPAFWSRTIIGVTKIARALKKAKKHYGY